MPPVSTHTPFPKAPYDDMGPFDLARPWRLHPQAALPSGSRSARVPLLRPPALVSEEPGALRKLVESLADQPTVADAWRAA
jgi:hypothetical protein